MRSRARGRVATTSIPLCILAGLGAAGCIVPADPGFAVPARQGREVPRTAHDTSWRDAQQASAHEPIDVEDRAVDVAEDASATESPADAPVAAEGLDAVADPTTASAGGTTADVAPSAAADERADPAHVAEARPAEEAANAGAEGTTAKDAPRSTTADVAKSADAPPPEAPVAVTSAPEPAVVSPDDEARLREAAGDYAAQQPPSDLVSVTALYGRSDVPSLVQDLVLGRAEGRVLDVQFRAGSDVLTLPFEAFRFEPREQRLVPRANVTELVAERSEAAAREEASPVYVDLFESAEGKLFDGVVLAIELSRPEELAEDYVFLKLRSAENHLQRVLLGPAWYVMRRGTLRTGHAVTVRGVETRDARGGLLVAAEAEIEGKRLELRDAQGRPAWLEPSAETRRTTLVHGLLVDTPAYVDGVPWGKLVDLVIEGSTGAVRFACIQPYALDLAGRWVVIPWSRASLDEQRLVLDVDVETLATAPTVSQGDVKDLHNQVIRDRIRRYYAAEGS